MKEDHDSAAPRANVAGMASHPSGRQAKLLKFALLLAVPVALSGCNTTNYGCDPYYEDCDDDGGSSGVYYSGSGSSKKTYSSSGSSSSGSYKGFGSSGSHSSGG
ncbi:hypothetical protein [Paenibacillus montanisoli]|nr:hypothetical protein [Paenibacillus montanisoli]